MEFVSRDMFSALPDPLISHILSFLPTKVAASTSVLAKRWRFLFASVTNLEFESDEDSPSFMEFVDRVLALQGNAPLNRFSLNCCNNDPVRVTGWILNVLERRVQDLDLILWKYSLPPKIFDSDTLVRLKGEGDELSFSSDVKEVSLPKLKTLDIDSVVFEEEAVGFVKLLSGCPVLEELVLMNIGWEYWKSCSVSVKTLKRLTFISEGHDEHPKSVEFDTPNLEYLEYSDSVAGEYPKVDFSSLVEAHISLHISLRHIEIQIPDASNFLKGICNVKILSLSPRTLEVLTLCCEVIPVFNNLIQLTIESNRYIRWDSLPALLKNCPNLETLIFKGLVHISNNKCGKLCVCKPLKNPCCLSSSTVKVFKIFLSVDVDDEVMETKQIKHFLETMPRLEQLIIYFSISDEPSVFDLSEKLGSIPTIASPKCTIQLVSPDLSLTSTLPSTIMKK